MDVRVIPLVLNKYKDVSIIFSLTLSTLVMLCNPPNETHPNILGNVYPSIFLIFVSINKFGTEISYQSLSYGNLKEYGLKRS